MDNQILVNVSEEQLLELLRGEDVDNFSVAITCSDGAFTVRTEMFDPPGTMTGHGSSFAEAWDSQKPWWTKE